MLMDPSGAAPVVQAACLLLHSFTVFLGWFIIAPNIEVHRMSKFQIMNTRYIADTGQQKRSSSAAVQQCKGRCGTEPDNTVEWLDYRAQ